MKCFGAQTHTHTYTSCYIFSVIFAKAFPPGGPLDPSSGWILFPIIFSSCFDSVVHTGTLERWLWFVDTPAGLRGEQKGGQKSILNTI